MEKKKGKKRNRNRIERKMKSTEESASSYALIYVRHIGTCRGPDSISRTQKMTIAGKNYQGPML
jgi:hypothetical protein